MRIEQIRFKNLNSLAGEWQIDLTHEDYVSDGIFAITGPTGSGKTTILDAICLALYGSTPRLGRITSENEIMSRHTGECFAEVTFRTRAGRFRCHWSQHRARRKPDGQLQNARHEISNAGTGEVINARLSEVPGEVEAVTGMDFGRFTRSMLLAQGDFAAFLQAKPDERAPILEQITGTEIYSLISMRVHERQREERGKLELLRAETAGIAVLEPERERELAQELEAGGAAEKELVEKSAATAAAIAWLRQVEGLKGEIANLADEAEKLQGEMEAFQPEREKLGRAGKAATLDGIYATLVATRRQQADDLTALKAGEEALPGLEASTREQAEALAEAQQQTAAAREALAAAAPVLLKVRALDQRLAEQQKSVAEGENDCRKDAERIGAVTKERDERLEKRAGAHEALERVEAYLKEHAQDEWLVGGLAGVEEQLNGLLAKQGEIAVEERAQADAAAALEAAVKALDAQRKEADAGRHKLEETVKQLQQGREALGRLLGDRQLRDYRAEKDALLREMAVLKRIADLEEHRAGLEDGKPCPLCGATAHPYAAGNVPQPDATEERIDRLNKLIGQAEEQEAAIRELEQAASLAREGLVQAQGREEVGANAKQAAEGRLAEVQEELASLRADFAGRREAVASRLRPLGITEIPEAEIAALRATLRERLKAWQEQAGKQTALERQVAAIDSEVKRLEAVIGTQVEALAERRERLEGLRQELATAREERKALYGDKVPDDEERRLNEAVVAAGERERQAGARHHELQQSLGIARDRAALRKRSIEQREPELKGLEEAFAAALAPVGFADEGQFLAARLPAEERAELAAKAGRLDERQTELKARQTDRQARLETELARALTGESLEELGPRFEEQEAALKELRDAMAGIRHALGENAAARKRIEARQAEIGAQQRECDRWDVLHAMIGSADGKKYRVFAQGLTFEMLIGHANMQLQKMSDRYLLVRRGIRDGGDDDGAALELDVIDNYQAGVIRSTKNLSGGESFIVSLALALGLSHMASRKVGVDSLFLDEGFGTLDEEVLDTALETLATLRQGGKLIGVISHVPALKERIRTQIQVKPVRGGWSVLEGPGCAAPAAGGGGDG